jgi:hypothetical protein
MKTNAYLRSVARALIRFYVRQRLAVDWDILRGLNHYLQYVEPSLHTAVILY